MNLVTMLNSFTLTQAHDEFNCSWLAYQVPPNSSFVICSPKPLTNSEISGRSYRFFLDRNDHPRSSFLVDSFHARELWLVTISALVQPRISSGASRQCPQVPVDPRRCIQAEYCGLPSRLDGQLLVVRCNTQLRLSFVSNILRPPRWLGWLIILWVSCTNPIQIQRVLGICFRVQYGSLQPTSWGS